MRNGILLAEDSPQNIMAMFQSTTLEEAFLILSQKQGQSEEADNTLQKMITDNQANLPEIDLTEVDDAKKHQEANDDPMENVARERYLRRNMSFAEQKPPGLWGKLLFTSKSRMKALLTKNVLQLIRQPS